jgi:hypothetical protein
MRLRPYQLNHPEEVTEGMNRLARAFSCLTDPASKKAYDSALLAPRGEGDQNAAVGETAEALADPLAWLFGPWSGLAAPRSSVRNKNQTLADWRIAPPPPRLQASSRSMDLPVASPGSNNGTVERPAETVPPQMTPPPAPGPLDGFVEAAQSSLARRGLSTRRALYQRMRLTRQLLRTWQRVGKYVGRPVRRLVRSGEAAELTRLLHSISVLLHRFPPLLGELGQPGFWVASLARHDMVVPIFRMLVPSQRETLARDWRDGLTILKAHRRFLLVEARVCRNQTWWRRLKRRVRFLFNEHPSLWAVVVLFLVVLLVDAAAAILWFNR